MTLSDVEDLHHLSMDLHIDTDTDRFPSFSTTPSCPSLGSSFASYGSSSPVAFGMDRRSSIPNSETSLILSSGTSLHNSDSPMTPFTPDLMEMVMTNGASMSCTTTDLNIHGMFPYNETASEDEDLHWMAQESKQDHAANPMAFKTPQQYSSRPPCQGIFLSPDQSLLAGSPLESSLSRSIFHHRQPSDSLVSEHMTQWRPSLLQTPPRTVVPSATFQPILPSSPAYRIIPSTPLQNRYEDAMTPGFTSTPCSSSPTYSPVDQPIFVKSESNYHTIQPTLVRTMRQSKCKGPNRSSRRSAERKESARSGRPSKSIVSRSGIECPSYIEKNSFACSEDCVDKTGKRKMFKRQEHLKRHQRTCHTGHRPYYCFVPGCTTRPFSRTDNLNSHLRKTHGKNSPAARNRYIATLDPTSGVYDLDYRGPFTDSGWPIRRK